MSVIIRFVRTGCSAADEMMNKAFKVVTIVCGLVLLRFHAGFGQWETVTTLIDRHDDLNSLEVSICTHVTGQ